MYPRPDPVASLGSISIALAYSEPEAELEEVLNKVLTETVEADPIPLPVADLKLARCPYEVCEETDEPVAVLAFNTTFDVVADPVPFELEPWRITKTSLVELCVPVPEPVAVRANVTPTYHCCVPTYGSVNPIT